MESKLARCAGCGTLFDSREEGSLLVSEVTGEVYGYLCEGCLADFRPDPPMRSWDVIGAVVLGIAAIYCFIIGTAILVR